MHGQATLLRYVRDRSTPFALAAWAPSLPMAPSSQGPSLQPCRRGTALSFYPSAGSRSEILSTVEWMSGGGTDERPQASLPGGIKWNHSPPAPFTNLPLSA